MKGKACAPVKTGILTFYCSDDCGAMLQAYGLKECAKSICPETEILPYAPYFMTGRHWLFPYYPSVRGESTVRWSLRSAKRNLRMGRRLPDRERSDLESRDYFWPAPRLFRGVFPPAGKPGCHLRREPGRKRPA